MKNFLQAFRTFYGLLQGYHDARCYYGISRVISYDDVLSAARKAFDALASCNAAEAQIAEAQGDAELDEAREWSEYLLVFLEDNGMNKEAWDALQYAERFFNFKMSFIG